MKQYKITYKKSECVGAGECGALSPELWKIESNGKASLKNAVLNEAQKVYELIIDETLFKKQKAVAGSCPAGCIKITEV